MGEGNSDAAGRRRWVSPALSAVAAVAIASCCYLVFARLRYPWDFGAIWDYRALFFWGWLTTLAIAAGALAVSSAIAGLLVAGQKAGAAPIRWACRGFIELVRGTPLLVQLLIGYYIVANAFGIDSQILMGILLLSGFAGAYLAEILRGGIESVGRSQIDAARAVGFSRAQIYRYVIIPQAVRRTVPAAAGQFASLIKDSSLLSVLGIEELTQQARIANSVTYSTLEGYLLLAVGYLVLTLPIAWAASALERKFTYES